MASKPMQRSPLPLRAARALTLHAQKLAHPQANAPAPDQEAIYKTVAQLGSLQIDTLHVVQRSHYLALWSRLGCYNPQDLDRLVNDPQERRLFEYWKHAACLVPFEEYRYALPMMRWYRENGGEHRSGWISQPENQAIVAHVLERIRREGGLRTADFEDPRPERGTWWDWKPAKRALEYLFDTGQLMISRREKFQRVYDLPERVLPDWVDQESTTLEERDHFRIEQAARALGIFQPLHTADYAYLRRGAAKSAMANLLRAGIVLEIPVELIDGQIDTWMVHRDRLEELQAAADGALSAQRTTFLSPFDSLFWAKGRDQALWGFRQTLEAYKPGAIREWGYFCLPILQRGRLVGRFDPSLDRRNQVLTLKALYLEENMQMEDELVEDVAQAMRDFMKFHKAQELRVLHSQPQEFGERLLAAI